MGPFFAARTAAIRLSEAHVSKLHLTSRESVFQVEIQAEQREGNLDRLGFRGRVLCGPGVDDVLMKECCIAKAQSPGRQFLVGALLFVAVSLERHDGMVQEA